MELRVLNYFLVVAREENITKAASLLHITQPTLSRQLMQLEEELGVKLFRRSNHNIILTNEGMLLKRRAQELISLAEKTKNEFNYKEELSGEIAIGSGEFQSTKILAELIASFQKEHPLIKYEIYSGNSDNIKERIEIGNLDLGLLMEPVDIGKYEFVRMPIKEEWGILINEDSELVSKESVCPEDLIDMPIIFAKRKLIQNELKNWLGDYASQIKIAASGNLLYNLANLAKSKIGCVMTIKLNCKYDGLCYIPLSPKLELGTILVWKKSQPFSPAAEAFIQYTKKCLKSIS